MTAIIMKKRTLTLFALGIVGLSLLILGWRGELFQKETNTPGVQVNVPATGGLKSGNADPAGIKGQTGLQQTEVGDGSDFFVEYRLERERTRGQRVEWLREVINNSNSPDETRQKAQEHLMAISRSMEKEVELENLLKAKGFKDAAVLVDDRTVTVIVPAAGLSNEASSQISSLVSKRTGVEPSDIVVIPKA